MKFTKVGPARLLRLKQPLIFLLWLCNIHLCESRYRSCNGSMAFEDRYEVCCGGTVTTKIEYFECCGSTQLFDTRTDICCNGKVIPGNGTVEQMCCGESTQLFDTRTDICCNGKVIPGNGTVEQMCCGGKLVSNDDYICCFDTPVQLNTEQKESKDVLECCSSDIIVNQNEKFCCGGKDFSNFDWECCNNVIMNPEHSFCYENEKVLDINTNFCGAELYNRNEKSCCEGVLNTTYSDWVNNIPDSDLDCCGTLPYKMSKELCCNGYGKSTPHLIPKGQQCCGDTYYDSKSQFCVNGKPVHRENNQVLCKDQLYEALDNHACCGSSYYNKNSHKCCTGRLGQNVIPETETCCGGKPLNETSLCCFGNLICEKEGPDDNSCCFNFKEKKTKTYSNKTQRCNSRGELVPIKDPNEDLCGTQIYNMKTEICCGVKKQNKSLGFNACCVGEPFNNRTQQCCARRVSNVSVEEGRCCWQTRKVYAFNDTSNPCLHQCPKTKKVYDPNTHKCCGGIPINRNKRKCCNDKVSVKINGKMDCCGELKYNKNKKQCCAGRFPISLKKEKCCHNKQPYQFNRSECLHTGEVKPRGSLQNLTDVEEICHSNMLRHGEGLVQAACQAKYAIIGSLCDAKVKPGKIDQTIEVDLWLKSSVKLSSSAAMEVLQSELLIFEQRHDLWFTEFKYPSSKTGYVEQKWSKRPKNVEVSVTVPKDKIKCRQRVFDKFKKKIMIIFLDKEPKSKRKIDIQPSDFIYLTKFSNKTQKYLSQLSPCYCQSLRTAVETHNS